MACRRVWDENGLKLAKCKNGKPYIRFYITICMVTRFWNRNNWFFGPGSRLECMRKINSTPFFTPYANWRIRLDHTRFLVRALRLRQFTDTLASNSKKWGCVLISMSVRPTDWLQFMLDVLSLSILCFNYVPALYWLYLLTGCHEMCFDDNSFSKRVPPQQLNLMNHMTSYCIC